MAKPSCLKIAIRQIRGNSGIDIWAENLCQGINRQGNPCSLHLYHGYYQFMPALLDLKNKSDYYDIIQSSTWNGFAFKTECPLVVTEHHVIHDPEYSPYKTIPQKIFHRWIYHCERKTLDVADAVTCDCKYTLRKLEEVFGYPNARLVYVGIDVNLFKPFSVDKIDDQTRRDKTVLFFAGNLSVRKGSDLLPQIMKHLGDDYVLLIATGQKQGVIKGCKNIINLGRLTLAQLIETYNVCDIFLSPSRLEGFGLSIAEAMACGKPVVATNCSSIPEIVVDGSGGFLCEMDNVRDFSEKILFLAADQDLREKMGLFNRKRVEEMFTVERMTKGYLTLYQNLLK